MRRLAPSLLLLLLGSCSQLTELSARFVAGRLAFVARSGIAVDCIHSFYVVDGESDETMWSVQARAPGACELKLPVRYGASTLATTTAARPLVPGRRYELEGSASGGNSLAGAFAITPLSGWRASDLEPEPLVDNESFSQ